MMRVQCHVVVRRLQTHLRCRDQLMDIHLMSCDHVQHCWTFDVYRYGIFHPEFIGTWEGLLDKGFFHNVEYDV